MCWVRPLMLVLFLEEAVNSLQASSEQPMLYDLRQGADLVWPIDMFRPALDTEVIPLLVRLENPDTSAVKGAVANKQLNFFVRHVWQSYKHRL